MLGPLGAGNGFLYGGSFITRLPPNLAAKVSKVSLHPSLRDKAREFMVDRKARMDEDIRATNVLHSLLRDCEEEQDARDLLSNTIANFSPVLRALQRTRPEGFLYAGNAKKMAYFEEVTGFIEGIAARELF